MPDSAHAGEPYHNTHTHTHILGKLEVRMQTESLRVWSSPGHPADAYCDWQRSWWWTLTLFSIWKCFPTRALLPANKFNAMTAQLNCKLWKMLVQHQFCSSQQRRSLASWMTDFFLFLFRQHTFFWTMVFFFKAILFTTLSFTTEALAVETEP